MLLLLFVVLPSLSVIEEQKGTDKNTKAENSNLMDKFSVPTDSRHSDFWGRSSKLRGLANSDTGRVNLTRGIVSFLPQDARSSGVAMLIFVHLSVWTLR